MDIEKQVKAMVAMVLKVNESQLTRETRFLEDLFIKSVQVVEIIAMASYKFSLEISLKEARENKTIGQLIDYVAAKLKR